MILTRYYPREPIPKARALAGAIVQLLRAPKTRQVMGEKGRRLVAEWYDGEAVTREMLKGYGESF